jgi:phosphatidyl-myo-inositol dimannoside synthase
VARAPRDYGTAPLASPPVLVTAGSQERHYKGHDVLIDAVAILRRRGVEVRAKIIGGGALHNSLVARARRRRVDDAIDFVGNVPGPDAVRDAIRTSDLFVLPSRTEGMPRVLLEAMATGVACVGTTVGGISEILDGDALFPPGKPRALASTVEGLIADPAALSRNASHCLETLRDFRSKHTGDEALTRFVADLWQRGRKT